VTDVSASPGFGQHPAQRRRLGQQYDWHDDGVGVVLGHIDALKSWNVAWRYFFRRYSTVINCCHVPSVPCTRAVNRRWSALLNSITS
jgi:hypothetical protein